MALAVPAGRTATVAGMAAGLAGHTATVAGMDAGLAGHTAASAGMVSALAVLPGYTVTVADMAAGLADRTATVAGMTAAPAGHTVAYADTVTELAVLPDYMVLELTAHPDHSVPDFAQPSQPFSAQKSTCHQLCQYLLLYSVHPCSSSTSDVIIRHIPYISRYLFRYCPV